MSYSDNKGKYQKAYDFLYKKYHPMNYLILMFKIGAIEQKTY